MKIADTMPFARELLEPTYAEPFRRGRAQGGPGEVELGGGWRLVAESQEPAVASAAEHLRQFLAVAVSAPTSDSGELEIRLRVDGSLADNPETHLLRVAENGIEVVGAGPVGVLQGVFRLEALMRERGGPFVPLGEHRRAPLFKHRIHRSPLSPFYVEELTGYDGPPFETKWAEVACEYPAYLEEDAGPDTFYHDSLLMRLAEHGFNGIWLRGALRKFARVDVFPEFGEDSDRILGELRRLCERAARFGMRVFLYLNEPMGLDVDDPFWEKYPQCQGPNASFKPVSYFCSSTGEVKQYLRESCRYLFEQVPELAGVLLITASEYPSHCYCHHARPSDPAELRRLVEEGVICQRCAPRTPQEIIGEIVTLIRDGVKSAKPSAEVIAWNWSWRIYEQDPQSGVLERLPEDVIVMGDFERGQPTRALDFDYVNDEYSIKVIGPSPRFMGVAEFQRGRSMPVYAKIQIGTTHENPDVPYLPALPNIARKYQALHEAGVTGMMTCWNFGNMPSLATEVANEFAWDPQPEDVDEGLLRVAARHFGPEAAQDAVAGWQQISAAHEDFPTSIPVMYYGPISRAPAFPLVFDQIERKFPRSWMLDTVIEADMLDWTTPFGAEKVLECYRAVAENWAKGVALMERGLPKAQGEDRRRLQREIGVAAFCRVQLTSAANVVEFLLTRDAMYEQSDAVKRNELLDRLEAICRAEIENARAAIPLVEADPRLGFHGEGYGYMVNRALIEEKIAGLGTIINERIPGERA